MTDKKPPSPHPAPPRPTKTTDSIPARSDVIKVERPQSWPPPPPPTKKDKP